MKTSRGGEGNDHFFLSFVVVAVVEISQSEWIRQRKKTWVFL